MSVLLALRYGRRLVPTTFGRIGDERGGLTLVRQRAASTQRRPSWPVPNGGAFPWEGDDDEASGPISAEDLGAEEPRADMSHFPKRVLANDNEFKLHNLDFLVDELETREALQQSDDELETSESGYVLDDEQGGVRSETTDRTTSNEKLNWGPEFGVVHTGDFLTIPRSRWQQLVPEHLPQSFDVEADFDRGESIRILQRPAVVEAIRYARQTAASGFTSTAGSGGKWSVHPRPIVFEPDDQGTGATTGLLSLVVWARLNGWLVAYVPDAAAVQGDRAEHIRIVRSTVMPGCWDVASHSAQFLGQQLAAHGELLKTLPIKKDVQFSNGALFEGKSLFDLVTFGLTSYTSADSGDRTTVTEVLYHYRMELNRVTAVPVLLAVDRYNGWWSPSTFVDPDSVSLKTFDDVRRVVPPMPSDRITNVCLFRSAGTAVSGLGHGLGAVALSRTRMSRKLYKACLSAIGSHSVRVVMRPYTFDEFKTVHWHYLKLAMMAPDAGWFWGPPVEEKADDDDDDDQDNEDEMIEATKDLPPTPEDYLAVPPSAVKHAYTLTSGYPSELVRLRGMQMFVIKGEEGKRVRIPS